MADMQKWFNLLGGIGLAGVSGGSYLGSTIGGILQGFGGIAALGALAIGVYGLFK